MNPTQKVHLANEDLPTPSEPPEIAESVESTSREVAQSVESAPPEMAQPEEKTLPGPLQLGERFVNWEIRGFLGRGGYGFVYDAYNVLHEKSVALKLIPNPPNLKRAKNEARVGEKLPNHPNVVKIDNSGVTQSGLVYLEMERVFGRTIDQALADWGCLTAFEMLVITWQICQGVAAAHSIGVIHRDLKPANVFLEVNNNNARVLDFGIATIRGETPLTTQKDLIHGSMNTLAPERLRGEPASFLSDIYSIGCMMYEMVTGMPPALVGLEEITFRAVAWAHMNVEPPLLNVLRPDFPAHATRLVHWCLAKKPSERFPNVDKEKLASLTPEQLKAREEAMRAPMEMLAESCLACAQRMIREASLRGVELGHGELAMRPLFLARAEIEKELRARNGLTTKPVPPSRVGDTVRLDRAARASDARSSERAPIDQTQPLFREAQPAAAAVAAPVAAARGVQQPRQPRPRLRRPEVLPPATPAQFISGVVRAQAAQSRQQEAAPLVSSPAPVKAPNQQVRPSPNSPLQRVMDTRVTVRTALYLGAIAATVFVLALTLILRFPRSAPPTAEVEPPAAALLPTSGLVAPPSVTPQTDTPGAPGAAPAASPSNEPSAAVLAPVVSSVPPALPAPSLQAVVARQVKPQKPKTRAPAGATPREEAPDFWMPSPMQQDAPSHSTPRPGPTASSPAPRVPKLIF